KLTEGVDDPRFSAILLTYPFKNDRKLVQQIGRVLRHSTEPGMEEIEVQNAIVVHCADYPFQEIWDNYLNYEKLKHLVTGEHYRKVVVDFLELQPRYEYFGKRFRKRLAPFTSLSEPQVSNGSNSNQEENINPNIHDQWQKEAWSAIQTLPRVLVLLLRDDFD
ncbi:unnamed protein product, partial [marine sediment metagenome]